MNARKNLEDMLGAEMIKELPEIAETISSQNTNGARRAANGPDTSIEVLSVNVMYDSVKNKLIADVWIYFGSSTEYSVVQAELLQNNRSIAKNTLACTLDAACNLIASGAPCETVDEKKIKVRVTAVSKGKMRAAAAFEETFPAEYVLGMSDVVNQISVNDPRNIKTPVGSTIHVSFDREAQLKYQIDYDYSEYRVSSGQQEVYLDMSGDICLNPGYTYVDGSYKTDKIFLRNGDTICKYANSEAEVTNCDQGSRIHYQYINKWICNIPKNIKTVSSKTDFHSTVTFKYLDKNTQKTNTCIAVISSRDYSLEEVPGNYKKIPDILFYWGCLEENTLITMMDGSVKKIKDLKVGEAVKSIGGNRCDVLDIMKGVEQKLICIALEGGKKIFVTKDHPFMTRTGGKAAIELDFQDEILTEEGYKRIEGAYPEEREFKVYSLVLSPSDYIWGNGIAVGDSENQGRIVKQLAEEEQGQVSAGIQEECDKINERFHVEY